MVLPFFSRESLTERSLKWDRSPIRDNNLRKNQNRQIKERPNYPKMHTFLLNTSLFKIRIAIQSKEFV
jgi:hypothetical protein